MRTLSHVVAMDIVNVIPTEIESADCPAEELYSYEQTQVPMYFSKE